jgi:hypothetical protein
MGAHAETAGIGTHIVVDLTVRSPFLPAPA